MTSHHRFDGLMKMNVCAWTHVCVNIDMLCWPVDLILYYYFAGQFVADATLVQTGGGDEGIDRIRYLSPCSADQKCDWTESILEKLQRPRWYATNQLLPDGRQIVMGGEKRGFTWEYVPANGDGVEEHKNN